MPSVAERLAGPAVLLALLLAVYADALVVSPMPVISAEDRDGHRYFSVSRAFGFGEIADGNLPLWNPHVFAGVPYHAGVQSALLYPVNAIYLFFPLPIAMNLDILFHVWLLGVGAYAWARGHSVARAPAILSGAISMFAAPYFLHAWSGHLTLLAAFAWAPFFFHALDRIVKAPSACNAALGVVAVTMMILAGYPQAAYNCALIGAIYLAFQLPSLRQQPAQKLLALATIAIVPAFVSAAQLAPAAEFAAESVRTEGVDRADSFEYSLAPQHVIRALAPGFFGGTSDTPFWGGGYPLETGMFFGRSVLLLMLLSFTIRHKTRAPALAVVLLSSSLALGPHTFVAPLFHEWVPGFDRFRAPGRFWMFVAWFGALLAGVTVERIREGTVNLRLFGLATVVAAIIAWITYVWVRISVGLAAPDTHWMRFVQAVRRLNEETPLSQQEALAMAGESAPNAVLATAIVLSAFAALCLLPMRPNRRALSIVALGCLELSVFARAHRQTFEPSLLHAPENAAYESSRVSESRVLNLANDNEAMRGGAYDISGYEPGLLNRFHRLLSHSSLFTRTADGRLQGNAVASLLRCTVVIGADGRPIPSVSEAMPRFVFVTDFEVIPEEHALLDHLFAPGFDPGSTVLFQEPPSIAPQQTATAVGINVLESSTDDAIVEIDSPVDGFLLCADAYSGGWRATGLAGSSQERYEVIPADFALRAIPLRAGTHRLKMYYEPAWFSATLWISIIAALALNSVLIRLIYHRVRQNQAGT